MLISLLSLKIAIDVIYIDITLAYHRKDDPRKLHLLFYMG